MQRILTTICCLALAATAVADEKLEKIEKELKTAHEGLKSFTSDMATKQDMELGEGMKMKMDLKGKMSWMRKGEQVLYRMEQNGSSEQSFSGQEMKQEIEQMMVCDGEHMYMLSEMMGQKFATKQKADPKMGGDTGKMFEALKEMGEIAVLDDDKFDGADCYVVQLTMKPEPNNPIAKQKYWFRKDIGMMTKLVAFNEAGKEVMTTTTTNVKVDASIDPSQFVFKAPEGVQVQDMSNMPGMP